MGEAGGGRNASKAWVLGVMCMSSLVIVMDGSITNVVLPTLARELTGITNAGLQWVVDTYVLAFATLLLAAGSAADRFGRRRLFLIGLALFGATSIGASTATTAWELIAWRGFMGVGAAMVFPSTLAIITDVFRAPSQRRVAVACWAGSSGLGVALGPIAAGLVLTRLHWGWVFLINTPIVLVATLGALWRVPESKNMNCPEFDLGGTLLSAGGVFGVVFGVIGAPERGWGSAVTVLCVASGAVAIGVFAARLHRHRASGRGAARIDGRFIAACFSLTVAFFGLFGFVFLVTQYFQFVQGLDALHAGLRTLPFAGFILGGAVLAAGAPRLASPGAVMSTGLGLMGLGFLWATGVRAEDDGLARMVMNMGLLGVGLGLVNTAGTDAILGSLPPEQSGAGSSVNDTLREVGGTLGVACMGSVFNSLYRGRVMEQIGPSPLPAAAKETVRSSVGAAVEVINRVGEVAGAGMASALRGAVNSAFMEGFRGGCRVAAWAALGTAVVLAAVEAAAKYAGRRG